MRLGAPPAACAVANISSGHLPASTREQWCHVDCGAAAAPAARARRRRVAAVCCGGKRGRRWGGHGMLQAPGAPEDEQISIKIHHRAVLGEIPDLWCTSGL